MERKSEFHPSRPNLWIVCPLDESRPIKNYPVMLPDEYKKHGPEPRNNDGREYCWWCWRWTEKRLGLKETYDICPKCNK